MRRKISASVDGGPSGKSRVRRPGSEDPHRRWRNFFLINDVTIKPSLEFVWVPLIKITCELDNKQENYKYL